MLKRYPLRMTAPSSQTPASPAPDPAKPLAKLLPAAASPELAGGAGFTYEDGVAASYLVALLAETTAQGLSGRLVKRVAVQQGPSGQPLDDLIVDAVSTDSTRMRLSLQVKRSLRISDAKTNSDFRETIIRAHATVIATDFRLGVDRVGAVTDEIAEGARRDFETLCEWARMDSDVYSFATKLRTEGVAGAKREQFEDVRNILAGIEGIGDLDIAAHRLLAHFILMRVDMLHEGSSTQSNAVTSLASVLQPQDRTRADDLWQRLLALVRLSEGGAAVFDRKTLVHRLHGAFRLEGSASLQGALQLVRDETARAAAEILNEVNGFGVDRTALLDSATAATVGHRFVQLVGPPGTGKSAILRTLVERANSGGTAFLLKADRLAGSTWTQYLASNGVPTCAPVELLVELAAMGTSTLFIDGLDRVEIENRRVLTDLLNVMLESPLLKEWRIVAALRDNGIEPLRTWLPNTLLDQGTATVPIPEFNDLEAETLAVARPALRPLLFGSPEVRAIARRPFFAAVLSTGYVEGQGAPTSEIDLAGAWWQRGGYSAEAAAAGRRRQALTQLAQKGAFALGRKIPALDVDPQAVHELQADVIIRPVRAGQTWRFAHDIFFEWAFLQLLISKGGTWLSTVQEAGEPPALGRVVELLSQSEIRDGDEWEANLARLEAAAGTRSQWLRAWMTGPISLPQFGAVQATFEKAMLVDGGRRISKLCVWFQAEKSEPNSEYLDAQQYPTLDARERLSFADLGAVPSDVKTWQRLCHWLLAQVDKIDTKHWAEVLTVLEVWQNLAANIQNPLSQAITALSLNWIMAIDERDRDWRSRSARSAEELAREVPSSLASSLRSLVLRASTAYPSIAQAYLTHLLSLEQLPQGAFENVLAFSGKLSQKCAKQLVDFVIATTLEPLPKDVPPGDFYSGPSPTEWNDLTLDDHQAFSPAAPSREPFASLFQSRPAEARRLVRTLANHAIEAWRQLHEVDRHSRREPIPLQLTFPWGVQEFWGDERVFPWYRGGGGSYLADSGLMALEAWAFKEIESGGSPDEVIAQVLNGQNCVAAVGIACSIAIQKSLVSGVTVPLLRSQRLWHWDMKRMLNESTFLIGATDPFGRDKNHTQTALTAAKRKSRKSEIRSLAMGAFLQQGELGDKVAQGIAAFPSDLPFDYVDERDDPATVASYRKTAELWAETAKLENYEVTPTEDPSRLIVQLNNPKAVGPEVEQARERYETMTLHLSVNQWTEKTLKAGVLGDKVEFDGMLATARRLDSADLFNQGHDYVSSEHSRQALVAGVAAVVCCVPTLADADVLDWAKTVCWRSWQTPIAHDTYAVRDAHLMSHPTLFAVQGLAGMLRRDVRNSDVLKALLELCTAWFTQIGEAALRGVIGLWDISPGIGWLGLRLGIQLSAIRRSHYMAVENERAKHEFDRVMAALRWAIAEVDRLADAPTALPPAPAAWVRVEVSADEPVRHDGPPPGWRRVEDDLDWSRLPVVLAAIPVDAMTADQQRCPLVLDWLESLERWTIERFCPPWLEKQGGKRNRNRSDKPTELYKWRRALFKFLACVSTRLDSEESITRFVNPILPLDDEIFASFAEPYVFPVATRIADVQPLSTGSVAVLQALVPRIVSHRDWTRSSWSDESMRDNDLQEILQYLFFVKWNKCSGSARFANDDWHDVGVVLDLVEPLLREHGGDATLASVWCTLAERAFDHYPIERFASHIGLVLLSTKGTIGWRGSLVPSRVATLIQRFSGRDPELTENIARELLRALDTLVDMGDRRAAAIQTSEVFRRVKLV